VAGIAVETDRFWNVPPWDLPCVYIVSVYIYIYTYIYCTNIYTYIHHHVHGRIYSEPDGQWSLKPASQHNTQRNTRIHTTHETHLNIQSYERIKNPHIRTRKSRKYMYTNVEKTHTRSHRVSPECVSPPGLDHIKDTETLRDASSHSLRHRSPDADTGDRDQTSAADQQLCLSLCVSLSRYVGLSVCLSVCLTD